MMRLAKGGGAWVLSSLVVTIALAFAYLIVINGILQVLLIVLFVFFLLLTCLLFIFFRDPERFVGGGVVAVADGTIREISRLQDPEVGECTRISTFMNIHNVHVNRVPLGGAITRLTHVKGSHLPAFRKESERNERVIILIHTSIGMVKVVQIAGTLARRIVPYITQGDTLEKGARLGLIRFGSRVDVYLPTKKIKTLSIHPRDRLKAGEDTLAELDA
ncbi:MAG TPA: phosphatidylserine decarboxylase [Candidatus Thermoplasmatota archaeon]|nr:phosphatidylserine decarboxylase [Candidatus Thermoplasmatota archaeon]